MKNSIKYILVSFLLVGLSSAFAGEGSSYEIKKTAVGALLIPINGSEMRQIDRNSFAIIDTAGRMNKMYCSGYCRNYGDGCNIDPHDCTAHSNGSCDCSATGCTIAVESCWWTNTIPELRLIKK